jgi:hypothetical protein
MMVAATHVAHLSCLPFSLGCGKFICSKVHESYRPGQRRSEHPRRSGFMSLLLCNEGGQPLVNLSTTLVIQQDDQERSTVSEIYFEASSPKDQDGYENLERE